MCWEERGIALRVPNFSGKTYKKVSSGLLKDVLDSLADADSDFCGAFRRSDGYVFARNYAALSYRGGRVYGMQRDQVHGALSCACGQAAGALGCSFADVSGAAGDLAAGAAGLFLALAGYDCHESAQGECDESGFHGWTSLAS